MLRSFSCSITVIWWRPSSRTSYQDLLLTSLSAGYGHWVMKHFGVDLYLLFFLILLLFPCTWLVSSLRCMYSWRRSWSQLESLPAFCRVYSRWNPYCHQIAGSGEAFSKLMAPYQMIEFAQLLWKFYLLIHPLPWWLACEYNIVIKMSGVHWRSSLLNALQQHVLCLLTAVKIRQEGNQRVVFLVKVYPCSGWCFATVVAPGCSQFSW